MKTLHQSLTVAELCLLKVEHSASLLHERCHHVNALLHTLLANSLAAQHLAILQTE
jgi:hypothetical protein